MRYEELPKRLRARVDKASGAPSSSRSRGSAGSKSGGRASWRCHTCSERFTTWAAVDRHDPTHTRIDCELEQAAS